jgi:hypothetical protein
MIFVSGLGSYPTLGFKTASIPLIAISPGGSRLGSTRKSPSGFARGAFARRDSYFAAMSSLTRWKNRARPVIRRTTFTACASGNLNAAFNSVAIASLSLPDKNR